MRKSFVDMGGQGIIFKAHQSQLECMQLNFSGTKIATASEKVRTLIKSDS